MKPFIMALGMSWILLSTPVQAQNLGLTLPNSSCSCTTSAQDSLEEPQSFKSGKFQGQCIDSCRFRPARILENQKELTVANILHFGSYYKTTLNLQDFEKIEMGFENFLPGISHVVLRFTLHGKAPALRLVHQTDTERPPVLVRTLVLSSEGVPPKDHKYTLLEAYLGNFLLVHRLVTGEEFTRWVAEYKHPSTFLPLIVPAGKVGKILLKGIQESDQQRLQSVYALFSNNCATSAFRFLDSELPATRNTWQRLQEALPIAGPLGTQSALRERKLF
ncbi:MAG: hypothetical protein OM95_10545 [Bdellovibrio sp. ArHS]|uniref:hypothetical protein n=1 Tax=Bdellovibrio sp. ArHS TaxID=1569284 RepID=UPI000582A348|nr:hypothetical protein [Bdellovibrio sp. ArHS]KHD88195.1 MAG: hypothetical protein OM95_10545 [Bdellovibrio sp. ArHS]